MAGVTPEAKPLVLLPGTLCDARLWLPVLRALGVPGEVSSLDGADDVRDLAALLLRALPPRFSLVGFSLGGIVALEMADQAPHRIARLALVASNARPDTPDGTAARHRLLAVAERDGLRTVVTRDLWPGYVAAARQDDAALRKLVADMADALGIGILRRQIGIAVGRADSRPRLANLRMPVLVVGGQEDRLCPPDRHAEIVESIPGARLVLLEGVGHFVPLEAPSDLASALLTWLRST